MDVHLADDVADISDVDFVWFEVLFDELAYFECSGVDVLVFCGVEMGYFGL